MIKQVDLRQLAADDIDAAVSYHDREAGEAMALRFIDALETGLGHLSRHPLTGSLRYSYEFGIPNLQGWTLSKFPYIVFYRDHPNSVDVLRVLHARSDVPTWLVYSEDP